MKEETKQAKLNKLLGLEEKAKEVQTRSTGKIVGITEEEIQEFRAAQGLIYFLQAPELFSFKICGHCEEPFYVSRKYVAYCSYQCIRLSLNAVGISWTKGNDIEALVGDPQVYGGNEPIWINTPVLMKLKEMVSSLPEDYKPPEKPLRLAQIPPPNLDTTLESNSTTSRLDELFGSSLVPGTTSTGKVPGKTGSNTKKPKRRIISSS